MKYQVTTVLNVEADDIGSAVTKALKAEGEVVTANARLVPKPVASPSAGERKTASTATQP